jgi:arylsulfatase A-like enzyme
MKRILPMALLLSFGLPGNLAAATATARPNFLFIAIDDLNDFAGYAAEEPGNFLQVIYPDPAARAKVKQRLTPNLDRLAGAAAPFVRSYCASALCGPSRTSLMTGIAPFKSGYYMHDRNFRLYPSLTNALSKSCSTSTTRRSPREISSPTSGARFYPLS